MLRITTERNWSVHFIYYIPLPFNDFVRQAIGEDEFRSLLLNLKRSLSLKVEGILEPQAKWKAGTDDYGVEEGVTLSTVVEAAEEAEIDDFLEEQATSVLHSFRQAEVWIYKQEVRLLAKKSATRALVSSLVGVIRQTRSRYLEGFFLDRVGPAVESAAHTTTGDAVVEAVARLILLRKRLDDFDVLDEHIREDITKAAKALEDNLLKSLPSML